MKVLLKGMKTLCFKSITTFKSLNARKSITNINVFLKKVTDFNSFPSLKCSNSAKKDLFFYKTKIISLFTYVWSQSRLSIFFLLSFRLKLPALFLLDTLFAEPCLIRAPFGPPFLSARPSLSVGECMLPTLRLDMELDRLRFDEIPRELG